MQIFLNILTTVAIILFVRYFIFFILYKIIQLVEWYINRKRRRKSQNPLLKKMLDDMTLEPSFINELIQVGKQKNKSKAEKVSDLLSKSPYSDIILKHSAALSEQEQKEIRLRCYKIIAKVI